MMWIMDRSGRRTVPGQVQRLARSNSEALAEALTQAGMTDLSPAQAMMLGALRRSRNASELAGRLRVTRQTVAEALAGLERSGYIYRVDDPADRRAKLVSLTDQGLQAVQVVRKAGLDQQAHWAAVLGPERMAALRSSLDALIEDL